MNHSSCLGAILWLTKQSRRQLVHLYNVYLCQDNPSRRPAVDQGVANWQWLSFLITPPEHCPITWRASKTRKDKNYSTYTAEESLPLLPPLHSPVVLKKEEATTMILSLIRKRTATSLPLLKLPRGKNTWNKIHLQGSFPLNFEGMGKVIESW